MPKIQRPHIHRVCMELRKEIGNDHHQGEWLGTSLSHAQVQAWCKRSECPKPLTPKRAKYYAAKFQLLGIKYEN